MSRFPPKMFYSIDQRSRSYRPDSVTRFGEIPPIWQNFKSLGKYFRVYLVFGKNDNFLLRFLKLYIEQKYCKWPNIEKLLSHLVTLLTPDSGIPAVRFSRITQRSSRSSFKIKMSPKNILQIFSLSKFRFRPEMNF